MRQTAIDWHTDFWRLHFNPVLGKQRIPDNPSLQSMSYEVIRPDSASSPLISDKKVQGIVSEAIGTIRTSSYSVEAAINVIAGMSKSSFY